MSLQFAVGERPIRPLLITLTNDDGSVIDLTGMDDVDLQGEGLPDGYTNVVTPAQGRISYVFNQPFTTAGVIHVRARIQEGAHIDYTGYIEFEVIDQSESATAIVTPGAVETLTGQIVSRQDVARAQATVAALLGQDLADAEWLTVISATDRYWLNQAVSFQAAYVRTTPDAETNAQYSAMTTGDVSVTFRANSLAGSAGVAVAPLAAMALSRLSWRRSRTMHPRPFIGETVRTYTNDNAFMWPLVRTDLPPYSYTWPAA